MAAAVETPLSSTNNKTSEERLSDGIMMLMRPSIEHLDDKVHRVRKSQSELSSSIDTVSDELKSIADNMPYPSQLDPHIKRLGNARRKVNIVNSILHNCQERLRKLHTQIGRETQKREQSLQRNQNTNQTHSDISSPANPSPLSPPSDQAAALTPSEGNPTEVNPTEGSPTAGSPTAGNPTEGSPIGGIPVEGNIPENNEMITPDNESQSNAVVQQSGEATQVNIESEPEDHKSEDKADRSAEGDTS